MEILLLEPFLTGSHQQWAEGYAKHSRHKVIAMGLPGRHWKWRMHGAAVTLARRFNDLNMKPDLILASDMLDLSVFIALTRKRTGNTPVAAYFHENQLSYPWSPEDQDVTLQRDQHYSFINFTTAATSDQVFFNSPYHHDSFLNALPGFLSRFPDHQETDAIDSIRAKSSVLSLGLDLRSLDIDDKPDRKGQSPLILWNHRWEHDKGPEDFFDGLGTIQNAGIDFRLAVLGEQYRKSPSCFAEARRRFSKEIVHWGYAESRREYAYWLWAADFLPVTGRQDFFGGSVVEAMYCGVRPLLPNRLAYPGHVPAEFATELVYEGNDWVERLAGWCRNAPAMLPYRDWVAAYDWERICPLYDLAMEKIVQT